MKKHKHEAKRLRKALKHIRSMGHRGSSGLSCANKASWYLREGKRHG